MVLADLFRDVTQWLSKRCSLWHTRSHLELIILKLLTGFFYDLMCCDFNVALCTALNYFV